MIKKEKLSSRAIVVKAEQEKHLGFFKNQISTLLSNTTWYENNFLNLFDKQHKTFVVEIDKKPVAFASFIISDNVAEIDATATKKAFQRLGLGTLCFKKAFNHLKNEGIQTIFLEVGNSNLAAIKFYEKLGFVYQNRNLKNYYNDGQDALVYGLKL